MMTTTNLSQSMQYLLNESKEKNADLKKIIAKAVQLGMTYQESKIKEGIKIVFDSLHIDKNTNK